MVFINTTHIIKKSNAIRNSGATVSIPPIECANAEKKSLNGLPAEKASSNLSTIGLLSALPEAIKSYNKNAATAAATAKSAAAAAAI